MADDSGIYTCARLCDLVHSEGAAVLATYGDDFYAGTPVVTAHAFGQGQAYYLASDPEDAFLSRFYGGLLAAPGIQPLLDVPPGVEVTLRQVGERRLLFVLNHTPDPVHLLLPPGRAYQDHLGRATLADRLGLAGYDVAILEVLP
jgi:beta-galactosidase